MADLNLINAAEKAAENLQKSREQVGTSVRQFMIGLNDASLSKEQKLQLLERIKNFLNQELTGINTYRKDLDMVQEQAQKLHSKLRPK